MSAPLTWGDHAMRGRLPGTRDLQNLMHPQWQALTPVEARQFPYGAVGSVFNPTGVFVGTAWLVGVRTAVTAAHCTLFGKLQLALPGEPTTIPVDAVAHASFVDHGPEHLDRHDIAVLHLDRAATSTGIALASATSSPIRIELVGCPAEFHGQVLTRQEAQGRLPGDGLLLHQADSTAGHSGGPVLLRDAVGGVRAAALHVGGFPLNPHQATAARHNTALLLQGDLAKFVADHLHLWG